MRSGFVYILTNKHHKVLYVGSTTDIVRRTKEHKRKHYPKSFTARYNCNKLVYFKFFDSIYDAAAEEKRLKAGNRKQKLDLILRNSPMWKDLWHDIEKW